MLYLAPPPTTFAQPSTQLFFGTVNAIVTKNWMKKITNTMIDMELEDSLKLKVVIRLMDKSVATWWDNLKLCTFVPIT